MMDNGQSILIVDDHDDLRHTLADLFTARGFDVRAASDGFRALEELTLRLPDILISDLNMPAMSGWELLSIVRQRFPSIGVIAMSGAYCDQAIPEGVIADAFYPKGITTIDSLLDAVHSQVRKSELHECRLRTSDTDLRVCERRAS